MATSSIIESFNIDIKDDIEVDIDGNATCNRTYVFTNNTKKQLNIGNLSWEDEFLPNAYDFFLNEKNGGSKRLSWIDRSNRIVEVPIAKSQIIEADTSVEASIKYKWNNFAHQLEDKKKWVYWYSFNSKLQKVTLDLKIEFPTLDEFSAFDELPISNKKWFYDKVSHKEFKCYSNIGLKQKDNIIEGKIPDIDKIFCVGLYYYNFNHDFIMKRWVEPTKLIVFGIASIVAVEVLKWGYNYFKGAQ